MITEFKTFYELKKNYAGGHYDNFIN